jgi:ADP-heptose:LPS heptosyltransferase
MEFKKALIISFSGIGDAVLTEVLCENLKKMYPGIIIDMVVKNNSFPLFLNNPCIDNVIPYYNDERKNFWKYIKKTWNVMKKRYDIILDVESTPRSELFSLFGKKAAYRAGWYKVSKHKFLWMKIKRGFFYNNKIVRDNKENVIKNLTKFLDPLIKISSLENYEKIFDFKIKITDDEKQEMKKIMENSGIDFSKAVVLCSVNAVSEGKRWRRDYMKKVLEYILDNYNFQLLFSYTPNEKEYTLSLAQELQNNRIFYNIETKDVRDLAKLMVNSDYYFGNEGGARHIAQAVELPGFAVFSPDASKKDWLVNNGNTDYDGIEAGDILGSIAYNMGEKERYDAITPEEVIKRLEPKLLKLAKN